MTRHKSCFCASGGPIPDISRRSLIAGIGALTASFGLASCSTASTQAGPSLTSTAAGSGEAGADGNKLELVLLGTTAGPPVQPDLAGISTALVVDGHTYLIDCGRNSVTQYINSGLTLASLESIFITHLHADHIADYYNFFLLGGAVPNKKGDNITKPIAVYGPGPAGGLPPKFGGGEAPVVNPADPTPGIAAMTEKLHEAYAYSSNIFLRDMGIRDVRTLADIREISLQGSGAEFTDTHPDMTPIPVMSDERVTVTATLVPHGPVFPAFAFRFDTAYGSVTFSGDTTYSDNLIRLATGTDVLVHEALNVEGADMNPTVREHMLEGHVEVQKVGPIAEAAQAKKLILTHTGDLTAPGPIDTVKWTQWAEQGYNGEVIVGYDMQRIPLA